MVSKVVKKPEPMPSLEDAAVDELVELLAGGSRRERQNAAAQLSKYCDNPEVLLPSASLFIECLDVKEARTRWDCLDILTAIASIEPSICEDAVPGAEAALFDEDSGLLRLAAFKFLCRFGGASKDYASLVWPLLDEAIGCCHGDPEFQDMLVALVDFSEAEFADEVKEQFINRMTFDAENAKDHLQKRAQRIIENLSK